MIALVFAALSGLSYGAADFSGAVAAKRADPTVVTIAVQIASLVTLNAVLVAVPENDRVLVDLGWGAAGGVAAAIALTCLYRALAVGPMATAASLTALVGTVFPVTVGLMLGDQLSRLTLVGVIGCVPAAVLVSAGGTGGGTRLAGATPRLRVASGRDAARTRTLSVIAGAGFGFFFIALSRVSADSGLFPLLGARVASIVVLGAALTVRGRWTAIGRSGWPAVIIAGVLDCAANAFYLLAIARGQLTWVAAVSSLYPVFTVLLARTILKERLSGLQAFGLLLAAIALGLVAAGR